MNIMKNENIDIKWLGVKTPAKNQNKNIVWGLLHYELPSGANVDSPSYRSQHDNKKIIAFWGFVGGKISFNEHNAWGSETRLTKKQANNGFEQIDPKLFTKLMWNNFEEDFAADFIAFKLSGFE